MNYRVKMKNIPKINLIFLIIILLIGTAFVFSQDRCSKSSSFENTSNRESDFKQLRYLALAQNNNSNVKINNSSEDNEDTVIINVSNFGRSNPFKPYMEKSLYNVNIPTQLPPINVPKPPEYNPDPNFNSLFGIKVSGILYDSQKPSAIINVDNSDYLVHKGDFIFNFYVKDITPDKIAIKYQNNVYRAGIGEIIEGIVNINPVSRKKPISYSGGGSTSNIQLGNPVTLPTLPVLK